MRLSARTLALLGTLSVLNLAPSLAQEPAEDEGPQARVARLVNKLGSDSFLERSQASRELRALGETSRSSLELAAKSADPEVRLRALELLHELHEAAIWAPSLVTLDWKDQPAGDALREIARQTGNHLLAGDHYGVFRDRPIALSLAGASFWEAVDAVCRESEASLRPHYDQRKPGLVIVSSSAGGFPIAHAGPVRAKIVGARRVFIDELDYEHGESDITHTFQFSLQTLWEDRLRLVAYRPEMELVEAVTDTGETLSSVQNGPGDWKSATSTTRQVTMTLRLAPPPVAARRLETLRLKWGLIAVGDFATLETDDWSNSRETHRRDDARLTVLSAEDGENGRVEMTLTFNRDLVVPKPREVLYQENALDLLDEAGQPFRKLVHDWRLTDDGLKVSVTFTPDEENGEPKTLRVIYPRLRSQHDLEVVFRDVPLPSGKPR